MARVRVCDLISSWVPPANEGRIYRPASDRVIIQTTVRARASREEGTEGGNVLLPLFSSDNCVLAIIESHNTYPAKSPFVRPEFRSEIFEKNLMAAFRGRSGRLS